MPTFGSLFAGIGGIDLGLERAGWECRWQVESDRFCRRVLAARWPDVPRFVKVEAIGPDVERVDMIAAGFPCQPVSVIGQGRAERDRRWLWPQVARIVGFTRPRWIVVENVPGLVNRGLGDVLADLAALGYDAEWDCIRASAFGAPHERERFYLIAYPAGVADAPVLRRDDRRRPPVRRRARDVQADPEPTRGTPRAIPPGGSVRGGDSGGPVRWPPEPGVGRVAYGVPDGLDRLAALGNAVVPPVVEWIGRRVMEAGAGE